ncbi:imidazole glycerol phosphate synthase subunit HisH [Methanococcus voltae]|uniref:Imidazole glycerol phosphate synthase subunit HisH n=1 Tax=Methanococcus voltae (strain ATCC BAA-1334 / A3) TaxID=456320 RepID=D7DR71_METV3|nr:imidazole glycerol phosphate synthase subunit HisH [Methanococcus voltae]MCS3901008.1 glutamine amidotransferase [Methanococcus voltae]
MIAIIDYNAGNLRSIEKAFSIYEKDVKLTNNPEVILSADKLVLPGVGNFGDSVKNIEAVKFDEKVCDKLNTDCTNLKELIVQNIGKVPFLGVCVGMQLLFEKSEESKGEGLGVFNGEVVKFVNAPKIPHMGWNNVKQVLDIPLFEGIKDNDYFYFVHSYYVKTFDEKIIAGTCDYGTEFTCAVNKDDIYATQFHPEKSGKSGLKMIENFVELI